ncbi:hypothetical protein NX026_26740 [Klebsiella pneumoniae]|nr:hypothetical protein [Klebsiella pneumoniae]
MGIAIRADNSTQFDAVPTDDFAISPITEKLAMTLIFAFAGKVKSKKSIDVVRMHKDIKPGFLIK